MEQLSQKFASLSAHPPNVDLLAEIFNELKGQQLHKYQGQIREWIASLPITYKAGVLYITILK